MAAGGMGEIEGGGATGSEGDEMTGAAVGAAVEATSDVVMTSTRVGALVCSIVEVE